MSDLAAPEPHAADETDGVGRALAAFVESVDADGAAVRHSSAVAGFSVEIARRLGLPQDEVRTVQLGAILHDVGKLCVPRTILAKRGPLTAREWRVMRRHAEAGEQLLSPLLSLAQVPRGVRPPAVLTIVRSHHERWDGLGYPDRLATNEIARGARIVAVADAFQAMIEPRPYRRALASREAQDELAEHSGSQFDPDCVDAMLDIVSERSRLRALVPQLAPRRARLVSSLREALSA